ncbi:hypothetical protein CRN76_01725 [Chryseobacterium indologenes]|uniref:lipocalin family protein n=1 Tax=Chryseobacterium indologenes TaxID=253 RepID=UPI000BFE9760|nr:lipocalin family protein [Chryseobacterium indologenes]ATN04227.1 hypothetical protein CRN76_01725 [Chryseobacterium indologenes]AYY83110.1 hypothetical protein EGX91_00175 [Chryseobacterium indologenes]QIX80011.1 hypothetical protein FOB56_01540 [Chryseobacterium indologenes]TLX26233.1 hypothetical protein FE904_08795 [Chryseobacterium indologenes]UDQ53647.1 lipocalin family protein [Chryseobacterium indologenes]
MKKIFLSSAILSILACSSSNDEVQPVQASMIGKWKLNKVEVYNSKSNQTVTHVTTGCDKESIHEFKEKEMTSTTFAPENGSCVKTDVVTRKYTYDPVTRKFWYEEEKDYFYIVSQLSQADMIFEDTIQDFDGDGVNDRAKYFFTKSN